MPQLELSPDDTEMLADVLEDYLGDLRMEIADTDRLSFREGLKKKEAFLKRLLDQLRVPAS
jgi:hypothetical protein